MISDSSDDSQSPEPKKKPSPKRHSKRKGKKHEKSPNPTLPMPPPLQSEPLEVSRCSECSHRFFVPHCTVTGAGEASPQAQEFGRCTHSQSPREGRQGQKEEKEKHRHHFEAHSPTADSPEVAQSLGLSFLRPSQGTPLEVASAVTGSSFATRSPRGCQKDD